MPAGHLWRCHNSLPADVPVLKAIYRRLVRGQDGTPAATPDRVSEAQALFRAGNAAAARRMCNEILQAEPGATAALHLVAEIAFQHGVDGAAIVLMRAGAAANPTDRDLVYKLGCLLEDAGDHEAAVEAYRSALQLDPLFAKAHTNLGATLQKMGHLEEAERSFLRAAAIDPSLWQAHYNLGNLYKLQGRLNDAVLPFQEAMRLRRSPEARQPELASLFEVTTRTKLRHDIEQLRHLVERGLVNDDVREAVTSLEYALAELEPEFRRATAISIPPSVAPRVANVYNRLLHFHDAAPIAGRAVNPRLDTRAIEADYFRNAPGITYADDFLTPEALAELRRFCLESTIWFDCRYAAGYVGSALEDGFICPLLAQIAAELPRALPGIFGDHKLTHLWGYKYDSERSGISEHADFAAINVNFWLAPNEANLDPASGGLVVWDKEAPLDWDFDDYNNNTERIRGFLAASQAKPVTVPHRQNRVVIFNSDLFHKTDSYRFRPGYENRRLNVTLLYGYRQDRDNPLRPQQ